MLNLKLLTIPKQTTSRAVLRLASDAQFDPSGCCFCWTGPQATSSGVSGGTKECSISAPKLTRRRFVGL